MAVSLNGLIDSLQVLGLSENEKTYSRYSCPKCQQYWYALNSKTSQLNSTKLQNCINCSYPVHPKKTEEEFVPTDKMFFGWYRCLGCRRSWRSAYSWVCYFQKCKSCSTEVYPHILTPLKKKEDDDDLSKPHEEALCEKCKKLGRCCKVSRNTSWDTYSSGDEEDYYEIQENFYESQEYDYDYDSD